MFLLRYSRERIGEILAEIKRVGEAEFAYEQPKKLLQELETLFRNNLSYLNTLDDKSDPNTVKTA